MEGIAVTVEPVRYLYIGFLMGLSRLGRATMGWTLEKNLWQGWIRVIRVTASQVPSILKHVGVGSAAKPIVRLPPSKNPKSYACPTDAFGKHGVQASLHAESFRLQSLGCRMSRITG